MNARVTKGWSAESVSSRRVIAIDRKTSRRTYQKKGALEPIHMVAAWDDDFLVSLISQ